MSRAFLRTVLFLVLLFSAQVLAGPCDKILDFQQKLAQLEMTPEYWDIPNELREPYREHLYSIVEAERAFDPGQASSLEALEKSLATSKIIALGDNHAALALHQLYAKLIEQVATQSPKDKFIATIEILAPDMQPVLDDFIDGKISLEEFEKRIAFDKSEFSIYPFEGYREILKVLRKYKIKSLAVYRPEGVHFAEPHKRERFVYDSVTAELAKNPEARVILLYGSWHFIGKTGLTNLFAAYRDQMTHVFTELVFPELQLAMRVPEPANGTIFLSNYKGVKTYFLKRGLNLEHARDGFSYFFAFLKNEELSKLEPGINETYNALMNSFQGDPAKTKELFSLLCQKVEVLTMRAEFMLKDDEKFKAVYFPKLRALISCHP